MKQSTKREFGDFQTPSSLSNRIVNVLHDLSVNPKAVIEPTCGTGSFLQAVLDSFSDLKTIYGLDINEKYICRAHSTVSDSIASVNLELEVGDFFTTDWIAKFKASPKPILAIGNLPWVTVSTLSTINGSNFPTKMNYMELKGINVITGKSNFDISEWMLMKLFDAANITDACLAFVSKVSVARKLLKYAKMKNLNIEYSYIFNINAKQFFNASVEACVFICFFNRTTRNYDCRVFDKLNLKSYVSTIGFREGMLLADAKSFDRNHDLFGVSLYKWRSGVKHDASKVLELVKSNGRFKNKLGEEVDVEDSFTYPLIKGSDLANNRWDVAGKWLIITQNSINETTDSIEQKAPKLWSYLKDHEYYFEKRSSRIYKNRSKYAMFGIGNYSFSKWKIAIPALYKKLSFKLIKPMFNKPVLLDDTCYFLPFPDEEDAVRMIKVLNSDVVIEFLSSFIFWDEKRPITSEILNRLDISLKHEYPTYSA